MDSRDGFGVGARHCPPRCDGRGSDDGGASPGHVLVAPAEGKKNYLDIACKAADHAWRHFIEQKNPGFPGHAEIELALAELYRVTGNRNYLDLSRKFIERRGQDPNRKMGKWGLDYWQDHLPIRQQKEIKGHAVRAVFFATGVADVALETGDPSFCEAARQLWTSATKRKMYVTGSVGSRPDGEAFGDDYELPNRTGYCESCSNCGMMSFAHRMLQLDGDAETADVLELALYNGVLHGISLDGKSTYSYATPLSDANHPRSAWGVCCASRLPQTLLQVGRFAYGRAENDVYVNLFLGGEARIPCKGGAITLRVETDYPWNGSVKMTVEPERQAEFSLRVRIPGWSKGATVQLNGERIETLEIVKGYAIIRRTWHRGDTVQVQLPMPVMRIEAHPRVLANRGKVAIQRGPIVYGLEGLDNGGSALVTLAKDPQFQVEHRPDLLGGVTVIQGKTMNNKPFVAIPFYALANRALSQQEVWVYQAEKRDRKEGWEGKLYREYLPQW